MPEHALPFVFAVALAALVALVGLPDFAFTDYDIEALPAATALAEGRIATFYELAPAYGGSFVLRAPFAWAAHALGGEELAVYRSLALPAVLASLAIGGMLFVRLREHHARGAWLALVLAVAHPLTFGALEFGHPEELLGAALCAAALLAAADGRPVIAGALLGAAVANKMWALIAVVPVLVLLSGTRSRAQAAAAAGAIVALVALPFIVAAGDAVAETRSAVTTTGGLFHPWQIFWFLGDPATASPAAPDGARGGPDWVSRWSHLLAAVGSLGLGAAWAVARRRINRFSPADAGLALALALLTRCLLDTWNVSYYAVPFVLVLLTWECGLLRRAPVLSTAVAIAYMVSFNALGGVAPDLQAAVFLGWAVPLWAAMACGVVAPARAAATVARGHELLVMLLPSLMSGSKPQDHRNLRLGR